MSRRCLIVYGSLMHPDIGCEMSAEPPLPVWVLGFRRGYFQTPMWRKSELPGRFAVLSVRPDLAARINGVLWTGVEPVTLEQLDVRERGYERRPLPLERIKPFEPDDAAGPEQATAGPAVASDTAHHLPALRGLMHVDIYVGRQELFEPALRPLPEYVDHCRAAAAAFGTAFLEAFEATTSPS